jgi:hypothetical protein
LTRPLRRSEVEPDAVVFRFRPHHGPSPVAEEKGAKPRPGRASRLLDEAEETWVQAGGRLVLALAESRGPLSVDVDVERDAPRKVHPLWAGVAKLRPAPRRVLGGASAEEAVTLFASGRRPLAARLALGWGEVFLLACPEVLENALLGTNDHLALLEALATRGRPVYFDEHAHGLREDRGLLPLLLDWGLGPSLALAAFAGLATLWRGRVRVGDAEDAWEDRRSDAVDLVDSLAQLYDRALRRNEAAALYHEAFQRAVALHTGLRGAALERQVRQLTGGREPPRGGPGRDMTPAELDDAVARINRAFGGLKHGRSR